ncbi:MAG: membrane protein [Enterobacterales bacterium]|jgi:membrane protein
MMKAWMEWLRDFICYLGRRLVDDKLSNIAATLTLTTLLAVIPLLAVIFTILAALPIGKDLGLGIQTFIFNNFVPDFSQDIQQTIHDFVLRASDMKTLGFTTLVITAVLLLHTIDKAFNQIWRTVRQRKTIIALIIYWLVLIFGPFLLGVSIALSSYFSSLLVVTDTGKQISSYLTIILPWSLTTIGLTILYILIPNTRVKLSHAVIGAVVAGLLFEASKSLFTMYVTSFPLQEIIYGALSAVPLFIIWVYISWMVILLGAEVCHGLENFQAQTIKSGGDNYFLDCLRVLKVIENYSLEEKYPERAEIIESIGIISDYSISESLAELTKLKIIESLENSRYCLLIDLSNISVYDFISLVPWKIPSNQSIKNSEFESTFLGQELLEIVDGIEKRATCSLKRSYHQVSQHLS